ncbi:hypothetical protein [Aeromicrobium sp. UC242_57]|uniref:hypothetical protein n=1 Tax=Aeromicrobium sp. UC242_57 TaxID=3374624 RepID=UPI0037A050FB
MARNRDIVMFGCGRLTDETTQAFRDLVRQAPRWLDVALVGYASEPVPGRVRVGLRSYRHRLFDAAELTSFRFPVKAAAEEFRLIPGNTDLIHLRFVAENPGYDRYWFVEDDVRFGGSWSELFDHLRPSTAGLLGTTFRRPADDPDWPWWEGLSGPAADPLGGFLPFGAVTRPAIDAIMAAYEQGWHGHYEAVWPTVVHAAGLGVQDIGGTGAFVASGDEGRFYDNSGTGPLAPGTFVWRPYHHDYDRTGGKIWHPVRSEPGGVHAS